ncbi:MAG: OsmC family protein [Thermoplasmata archaeon]|nr:OsmC family protein [Thermoplasmata archaeon]
MTSKRVTLDFVDGRFLGSNGDSEMELFRFEEGVTPVEALLMAAAACSVMDVNMILGKRKVDFNVMRVEVEAEKVDAPSRLESIHLRFASDAPREEMERAVRLSLEKYCTVINTVRGVARVTSEIVEA